MGELATNPSTALRQAQYKRPGPSTKPVPRPLRLRQTVIEVSGKEIHVKYVEGPVGVQARNPSTALRRSSGQGSGHRFSKARIKSLGWEAKVSLKKGIARTYPWIEGQVKAMREKG